MFSRSAAPRNPGVVLAEVVRCLCVYLEALRDSRPLRLFEAEVEIPFTGTHGKSTPGADLEGFTDISFLTEEVRVANMSKMWVLRLEIKHNTPGSLRIEKYDTTAAS